MVPDVVSFHQRYFRSLSKRARSRYIQVYPGRLEAVHHSLLLIIESSLSGRIESFGARGCARRGGRGLLSGSSFRRSRQECLGTFASNASVRRPGVSRSREAVPRSIPRYSNSDDRFATGRSLVRPLASLSRVSYTRSETSRGSVRHERCGGGEGRVEKDGGGGGEGKRPGKRRQERNPGTRERERVYTRARGGRTQRTRTDAAVARKKSGLGLGGGGREAGGVSGTKPRGNRRGREERAGVRERKGGRRGGTRRAVERAQEKEAREDRVLTCIEEKRKRARVRERGRKEQIPRDTAR